MTLLDISQSSYIFQQQITIGSITIVICLGLTTIVLVRLKRKLAKTDPRQQAIGQTIIALLAIWTIYFFCFLPVMTKTIRLKRSGAEIIGKTIQWIYTDDSRMMEYSFIVNGATFTGCSEVVYGGQEIPGIKYPDGNYVVIYDDEDPTNSVMDFKRTAR